MENNLQARRVIHITNQLLLGKKLTVNELHEYFKEEYPLLTKRTLQRDFRLIQEIIPILEDNRKGKTIEWQIPRKYLYQASSIYLTSNEILSLYFLKAYLKLFKGTVIEEQAVLLTQKLEELAPDDVISEEILFNDKNIGFFDYSDYDPIIRQIIRLIREKREVVVEYQNQNTKKTNKMQIVFQMLFTYSELLYAVVYVPKHESHIALSIQNIIEIAETDKLSKDYPVFNFADWSKDRFGVFWGEPVDVELEIQNDYRSYFENRLWHPTQKFINLSNGNLLLKMTVPIVPDFTAWLMSWGEVMKVLKPTELVVKMKRKYQLALSHYES